VSVPLRHEGEPGVVGELEVTGAARRRMIPALLESDDGVAGSGASPSVKAPGRCAAAGLAADDPALLEGDAGRRLQQT